MTEKIPVVHVTDLYHPPQDPDDHFDLAALFALEEIDIKAVLLDSTKRFIDGIPGKDHPRDPGFAPVMQLSYLAGRSFPVAVGPSLPLKSVSDDVSDRPEHEQAAVRLLLKILGESDRKIIITCVGSARIIAAAINRDKALAKEKIRALYVNIGASDPSKTDEWNVNLDVNAWLCLMESGIPVEWYPCTGENGPFCMTTHNTFWKTTHRKLISDLPQQLRAWFHYALTGNQRGDIIRILSELGNGASFHNILDSERNLWSTVSLVMAAGRILAKTPEGWRFVPEKTAEKEWPVQKLSMISVKFRLGILGEVYWENDDSGTSKVRLFQRSVTPDHAEAFSEAFNALLKRILVQ